MKKAITILLVLAAAATGGYLYYGHGSSKRLEANPEKQLGAGGQLVRETFRAWNTGDYPQVFAKIAGANLGTQEKFVRAMKRTPIHWQMLEFVSEEKTSQGWKVALKLETTDPASAFAAFAFNMKRPGNPMGGGDEEPILKPYIMGIEELVTIRQTWVVAEKDGKPFIDIDAPATPGDTYPSNIINYAVHSSLTNDLPQPKAGALSIDAQKDQAGVWMNAVSKDLGLTLDEMAGVMLKAAPMVHKAAETYNKLARELRKKGKY